MNARTPVASGPAAPPDRRPRKLSPRGQLHNDTTVGLGPAVAASQLSGTLWHAHLITSAGNWAGVAWLAGPAAVIYWHALTRPEPPPPAGRARRALTWAAAILTGTLATTATAAMLVIAVTRHDVTGWTVPQAIAPGAVASVTLRATWQAIRRSQRTGGTAT